jgi:hypothetical protein
MQASRSTPCKVKKLRLSNKSAPHRSNSLPTPPPPPPPLHTKRSSLKRANTTELKRVCFGTVHIREHPIIPSDNPGGVKGPPVTIDWNHLGHSTAHVNDYEEMRPKRRTASQLIMPFTYRQELLRESGFTLREIQEYTKKANVARRQRKKTAELSHLSGFSETTEKLTRGLSNLTLKRGKKQKERALLKSVLLVDEKTRLESMELTEDTSMLDEEEDEEDDELIQSA